MHYLGTLGVAHDITPDVVSRAMSISPSATAIAPQIRGLTTVTAVMRLLSEAEAACARATNELAARASGGELPEPFASAYDGLRHALQGAQRDTLAMLRLQLTNQFGKSSSDETMAGIGFPEWLPRADAIFRVSVGERPFFIGPRAEVYASERSWSDATVLTFTNAAVKSYIVMGLAQAVRSVTAAAHDNTQASIEDLAAFDAARRFSRVKKLAIAVPVVVGGLLLGGIGWWLLAQRRRSRGTSGVRAVRHRGALRGATRLTSLNDPTPSRYQLEV